MRQMRWAIPGTMSYDGDFSAGALRVVIADGRTLLAGMYCSAEGFQRVDLRDAATGEVVDVHGLGDKEWWHDPAAHFTSFTWQGHTFVLYITGRPRGCRVLRVARDGFEIVQHFVPGLTDDDGWIDAVALAVFKGRLALLAGDFDDASRTATFRDVFDGDQVLGSWHVPEGWECSRLVSAGERSYAWLEVRIPDESSAGRRLAAERGRWLWDVTSNIAAGPPLRVCGVEHGLWSLNERPVALFEVGGWRDHQLWDLLRRQPLGPGLGNLGLLNPQVGLLYGRPVLAGTTHESLRLWDIATGRPLGATDLPDTPIATTIGPNGIAWAITRTGYVGALIVTPAQVHPSTARRHARRQAQTPVSGDEA